MNKTFKENINAWEISTDASHIIHRIGGEDYPILRRAIVTDPEEWEEVAVADIPPYTNAQYAAKVSELIHQKYSLDDEIALRANLEDDPTEKRTNEFAEYLAFRKQCKEEAKKILIEETKNSNATTA